MDIWIETLGGLNVRVGDGGASSLREQPIRAGLLLYLAMEGEATRDRITGILWPDQAPDRARHTLSQTLYRLRQDLGENWVTSEGEHLRIGDHVRVDAVEFMEGAQGKGSAGVHSGVMDGGKSAEVQSPLALYKGPFLEGWGLTVSSEFEHWCDRQCLRLSRLHRELCRTYIAEVREGGSPASALEAARHWVEVDPMEDEAHHLVIELLAESGHRAEALDWYSSYEELLAGDDLQPLDETIELVKGIREKASGRMSDPVKLPDLDPVSEPAYTDPKESPRRKITLRRIAPFALFASLAAFGGWWIFQQRGTEGPPPTDFLPNRVLVVPLENRTEQADLASVGELAADWITRGLSDLDFLEVRPAGEFMASEWATDIQSVSSEAEAAPLVSRLGAGILVSGTYYTWGSGLEFHVQILEFPGGNVMEAIGPVRSESLDPMEAVDIIRQRVAVALAIHLDENSTPFLASTLPPTFEAYQAYSSGALKFVVGDRAGAVADLEEAYHRSPDFTAPLIYAAFGRMSLGDPQGADSLAKILEADRENLPPYDRFRVDLLQARLEGDNAEAYRAVSRAAELLDGGSAHYMSAQMALELNRPREALEILQTFDMTREWAQGWANYWNVVTAAHHLLGNHDRELELASQGYRLNPDRMLMLAWEVRALAGLGRWEEIKPLLARAGSIRGPDRMTTGTVMLMGAHELRRHGYDDEALACLDEALNWVSSRALENPGSEGLRAFRAQVLYHKGTLEKKRESEEAAAALRQARLEFEALAEAAPGNLSSLGHLGAILAHLGNAAEARELSDSLRALDRPYLWGQHTLWRARIAALLGERDEAVRLLWQSVGEGISFGMSMHADPDLEPLLGYPPFEEFIRPQG